MPVEERVLGTIDGAALRAATLDASAADAVVLWLRAADLARLAEVPAPRATVYVSATLAGSDERALPAAWRATAQLADPYELPERRRAGLARFHAWLQTRGLPLVDERVQFDAYLACLLMAEKVDGSLENLTRDHLVERAEAILSMRLVPGIYHRLSLGPAQRFASKGGYLARFREDGTLIASDWIVP